MRTNGPLWRKEGVSSLPVVEKTQRLQGVTEKRVEGRRWEPLLIQTSINCPAGNERET